jgi:hypothetical protein
MFKALPPGVAGRWTATEPAGFAALESNSKKNPAFAGSSSFTERSILLLSFSFFFAPHLSGFLIAQSLLSIFFPVAPQRNCFLFPSPSSVHHHHPHEVNEYKATPVPESVDSNVINDLEGPSLKVHQDLRRAVMNP